MVMKRCTNHIRAAPKDLRDRHLSKLMFKLKVSGYNEIQRRDILISGLRGYERLVREEKEGRRPINRPEWMGQRGRRLKKLIGKKTWFNKKRRKNLNQTGRYKKKLTGKEKKEKEVMEREVEAVMFIPFTKDSKLQRKL